MRLNRSILKFLGFNTQGDLGPWTFYTSKRKGLVFFVKSPPLEPPSPKQVHQRNKFRVVGFMWRSLTPQQRKDWELAALAAHLQITGYNLFTYYVLKDGELVVQTVEAQSGITLLPLTRVSP